MTFLDHFHHFMVSFSIFLPRLLHLVIMSEDRARDGEMSPTASGRGAATKGSMRPQWPAVASGDQWWPHITFLLGLKHAATLIPADTGEIRSGNSSKNWVTAVTDYYTWHQGILQLISRYLLSSTGPLCLGVFIFFMFIMLRNVGCVKPEQWRCVLEWLIEFPIRSQFGENC